MADLKTNENQDVTKLWLKNHRSEPNHTHYNTKLAFSDLHTLEVVLYFHLRKTLF